MSYLIQLHGTNGSGKSTLVRNFINKYGIKSSTKIKKETDPRFQGKVSWTILNSPKPIILIGDYSTPCGGQDTIGKLDDLLPLFEMFDDMYDEDILVISEGSMGMGMEKCKSYAEHFKGNATFMHLDTPSDVCLERVTQRRKERFQAQGKEETPLDPYNLLKLHRASMLRAGNLARAGLNVISTPDASKLLDVISQTINKLERGNNNE